MLKTGWGLGSCDGGTRYTTGAVRGRVLGYCKTAASCRWATYQEDEVEHHEERSNAGGLAGGASDAVELEPVAERGRQRGSATSSRRTTTSNAAARCAVQQPLTTGRQERARLMTTMMTTTTRSKKKKKKKTKEYQHTMKEKQE